MSFPELRLKKREERRLLQGHLWVFSNEVDIHATPLTGFAPGDLARVVDASGRALGLATVNPASLIAARILTRDSRASIDGNFFRHRIDQALRLRERLYPEPFYRLVYGESDGLPGLVVDRFGDVLVVQANTAGMDRLLDAVLVALDACCAPRALVIRNVSSQRRLEGLEEFTRIAQGSLDGPVEIVENGARFVVDVLGGQKTGWFYDHRDNRRELAALSVGRRVLDLFCYSGAWGVSAALAGATEVVCVDSSERALELVHDNARRNGVAGRVRTVAIDAFDGLAALRADKERFDSVVLDPPALIKRKKDLKSGTEAYHRLNQAALGVLVQEGILVSASCSQHLDRQVLREVLRTAARRGDRHLRILREGGQGADHPVHPAIPETAYLKSFTCHVVSAL